MNPLESPQVLLLVTAALNALLLWTAHALARRATDNWLDRFGDTLLLWFAGQYVIVGAAGMAGVLSLTGILCITLLLCTTAILLVRRLSPLDLRNPPARIEWAGILTLFGFLGGYLLALAWIYRVTLPTANDALTYHLPAAAQWLQDHRITLLPTWNFNPANTYSPLAGSALAAWWMAPLGCDFLARFVAFPPLLLILVSIARIARAAMSTPRSAVLRVPASWPALMLGMAAALCWPILSQADKAKDDLYVVAFFLWAVAAISVAGRWRAARVGIAIGLLCAMKYTAILALPMFLPAISRSVSKKKLITAGAIALALAGPWYVRNLVLTGNPVFPIDFPGLRGLFSTSRATEFRSLDGLWTILGRRDYSYAPWLLVALALASVIAIAFRLRRLAHDRTARVVLLGPWIGLLAIVLTAPFAEIRFLLPCVSLAFAGAAFLPCWAATIASIALGLSVIATTYGFKPDLAAQFQITGAVVAGVTGLIGLALLSLPARWQARARRGLIVAVVMLLTLIGADLYPSLLADYLSDEAAMLSWEPAYTRPLAEAWVVARHERAGETVAYAGSWYPYPLQGPDLRRRVIYVSPIPAIESIPDLPHLGRNLTGDQLVVEARSALRRSADAQTWHDRLVRQGVHYVLICKQPEPAPELQFVQDSSRYAIVLDNPAAILARVR